VKTLLAIIDQTSGVQAIVRGDQRRGCTRSSVDQRLAGSMPIADVFRSGAACSCRSVRNVSIVVSASGECPACAARRAGRHYRSVVLLAFMFGSQIPAWLQLSVSLASRRDHLF
jgi:hypothetical protein